jgi:transposase
MTQRKHTPSYTAEFRTRGVRLFNENRADYASDNAAYRAIAPKLGCSPDSLRAWCQRAARDAGKRSGLTSEEKARLKALEREKRELRQANEILNKAMMFEGMAPCHETLAHCSKQASRLAANNATGLPIAFW